MPDMKHGDGTASERFGREMQRLLDAMDGVPYVVDGGGTIIAVGHSGWDLTAAQDSQPLPVTQSVIGKSLFDLMHGEAVCLGYRNMHAAVASGRHTNIVFEYRCDAPEIERHMRMSISRIGGQAQSVLLLYQSQMIYQRTRPIMHLFSDAFSIRVRRGDASAIPVLICSLCHDVGWPVGATPAAREWIKPEEFYRRGGPHDVVVSHDFCPPCVARIVLPNS